MLTYDLLLLQWQISLFLDDCAEAYLLKFQVSFSLKKNKLQNHCKIIFIKANQLDWKQQPMPFYSV